MKTEARSQKSEKRHIIRALMNLPAPAMRTCDDKLSHELHCPHVAISRDFMFQVFPIAFNTTLLVCKACGEQIELKVRQNIDRSLAASLKK